MANFKSLKALKEYLSKSIDKAIKDEPPKAVKNLMKKHILRDVYMVYKPFRYERRLNRGGLLDENNILIDPKQPNTVEVYNITKRSTVYTNDYTANQMYLAPVIEFGHDVAEERGYRGYSYPNPKKAYYHARPFIRNTRNSLAKSKSHVKAFQQSLKKLGINTK
jgi:hypothetical protein